MADAVIVSTARTPIGKAYRGAFNNTHGADMGGHVIKHAVERAGRCDGRKHCASSPAAGGTTSYIVRNHRQSVLLLWAANHFDGGATYHR